MKCKAEFLAVMSWISAFFICPQIVKFIKVFILGVRKITPLRSSLKRRDLFKVVEVSRSLCAASKRE